MILNPNKSLSLIQIGLALIPLVKNIDFNKINPTNNNKPKIFLLEFKIQEQFK